DRLASDSDTRAIPFVVDDHHNQPIEYQPQRVIESAAIPISEPLPRTAPIASGRLRLVKRPDNVLMPSLENYMDESPLPAAHSDSSTSAPLKFPKRPLHLVWMIIILIMLMAGVVPSVSWYMRRQTAQAMAAARQCAIEAQRQRPPGLVMITGGQF